MTTCHIESGAVKTDSPIELVSIGKKYPLRKHSGRQDDFAGFWALKDVTFNIEAGRTVGIIGRNGAGKTTLLNIIAGTLSPSAGNISVQGKTVALFNLGSGFQDELSGRENIFLNGAILGASRQELNERLHSIIEFSELGDFINMPLGSYSQGMRLRLGFSILANLEFDILIIDEVLAVGDALFQHKCFARLLDFKRAGKTLIISTQDMGMIERFCDSVLLLDHGSPVFYGAVAIGVNSYRALLNSERFFVGPARNNNKWVEDTKKWADDVSGWGRKLGTKEAVIEKVRLLNRFGVECSAFKPGEPLKIKVYFTVRTEIKEPHFGAAIFRADGVYCYGPNTEFDGHKIGTLKKGRGYFILACRSLMLAPGEYRISAAIWDKNETVPYDYHNGYYKLTIAGRTNPERALLRIPFKLYPRRYALTKECHNSGLMSGERGGTIQIEATGNNDGLGKNTFFTNEPVLWDIRFSGHKEGENGCFWAGIFRDDAVYCQGITAAANREKCFRLFFSKLALLPGNYYVSSGSWDKTKSRFTVCQDKVYSFKMVSGREDHGTVFLSHIWKWGVSR